MGSVVVVQASQSIERRRRNIYIAAAAIIAGAMLAFVVTMSLSTSYPGRKLEMSGRDAEHQPSSESPFFPDEERPVDTPPESLR